MLKDLGKNIINRYIKSGIISYETTLNGNYKKGNKEYPKLQKLLIYLSENLEIAKEIFPTLLKYDNVEVKTIASSHCLMLGIYIKEAEEILQNIANDEKNGIFSLNAEMTLKVWKEGNLTIYRKNK